jgi:predicted amidophosphoribosyltransferase
MSRVCNRCFVELQDDETRICWKCRKKLEIRCFEVIKRIEGLNVRIVKPSLE